MACGHENCLHPRRSLRSCRTCLHGEVRREVRMRRRFLQLQFTTVILFPLYPMKKLLPTTTLLVLALVACAPGGGGGNGGGGIFGGGESASSEPLPPQDRNGPCSEDDDCMETLTCVIAPEAKTGTCQFVCKEDADCGNNALCRDGGCQKDCAEKDEKCSENRICCFFDADGDRKNDASCTDLDGDMRCRTE